MRSILVLACFLAAAQESPAGGQESPGAVDTARANAGHADSAAAGHPDSAAAFVYRIVIDGAISPASAEFIIDAIEKAGDDGARALVIELDTPGGLVESTRDIVQAMLGSPAPVVVYVAPAGARAGSAGVFLTLAAHVAAMAPGTNIGAATPIGMGGRDIVPERPAPGGAAPADSVIDGIGEEGSDLDRKILNDTVAFIRTIAERRGRNADWAERAVREAVSITETQALEENVVDLLAPSLPALLDEIDGREVDVAGRTAALRTADAEIRTIEKGLRFKILDAIANPNIAFVLMLIGIYGIFFELMNPGAILPGVVGVISLLLGFFALQALPVNYVGVLLLLFSLILFIAEVKVASYGLLTVGGIIAFVLGATMLFDAPGSFFRVSWSVIIPAVILTAGFFVFAFGLAYRTWRTKPTTGREGLVGERGVVRRRIDPRGQIQVHGEIWSARADEPLDPGTAVEVVGSEGLTLHVKRV
ncbi:MAG TPA: nodulation protein NfeD [Gemmatimonadota bacterium]|nr:nodulation protein NfeD [Gemmatimonadota bacterium]